MTVSRRQHSWRECYICTDRTTQGTQIQAHSAFTFCISLPSCLPVTTTSLFFQLNAAVTVQTLIDVFGVSGIVHYGTAGSSNDSLSFGDVSVPKLVAYTGAWTWKVPIQLL